MRLAALFVGLAVAAAAPAAAFESAGAPAPALHASHPLAPRAPAPGKRPLAAFAIDDQLVTLNAYGRRARARMNGDIDGLREARAMGKVFDGAPQPALITIELSLRF